MTNNIRYIEIAQAEMQSALERQIKSFDTIKASVRSVLSAASLIVSLVSALQLVSAKIDPDWVCYYKSGVILAAVLYVALIVLCITALWPVYVWSPLKADWKNLTETLKSNTEEEMELKYLSSILSAIEKNIPRLNKYARLQAATLIILPIIVVILLLVSLIPRV